MSNVTNLVLSLGQDGIERPGEHKLAEVNRFPGFRHGRGLVSLEDPSIGNEWHGGTKYLEVCLSVGAFRNLDLPAFLAHLRAIPWRFPEDIQVFVQEQDDARFRLIDVMAREPIAEFGPFDPFAAIAASEPSCRKCGGQGIGWVDVGSVRILARCPACGERERGAAEVLRDAGEGAGQGGGGGVEGLGEAQRGEASR